MATAAVLDFDKLLAPFPGDNPAGVDLRADPSPVSDYYTIRGERDTASTAERRLDRAEGDPDAIADITPPKWQDLRNLAVKALEKKAKDIEVAGYLIEALVRLHGFAGIRDGFRLVHGFVEIFWDHIYPVDAGGDVETRFSRFLGLLGMEDNPGILVTPIAKFAITADTSAGEFTLANYHQAQATAKIADPKARQRKIEGGALTLEVIQRAVAASPPKFYADLVEDIGQSVEAIDRFCKLMAEKSGYEPRSSDLTSAIDGFLVVVKDIARDKIPKAVAAPAATDAADAPAADAPAAAAAGGVAVPAGAILTRDDALVNLEKVAEFFRKTEPHSIIPYALEQVVTWGRMPLPDLLAELIPDDGPRKNLFKQVGIK